MKCTLACWAMPDCSVCGRRKAPRGRSVPMEAATSFCNPMCIGYFSEPLPGHHWPEEEPELKAKFKELQQ